MEQQPLLEVEPANLAWQFVALSPEHKIARLSGRL